jgi:hypothetical protein
VERVLSLFSKNRRYKDNFNSLCKLCAKKYKDDYYKKNAEKINIKSKIYRENNTEKCKLRSSIYYKNNTKECRKSSDIWLKNNPEKRMVIVKKSNAKSIYQLTDSYIRLCMRLTIDQTPPELIEQKREQLEIIRAIRTVDNAIKQRINAHRP